ncbi:hypothetical protein HHK36_032793 [Tetracentron sinense]|uniref:TIR domain-containing protein n=1 Tax=Tetracentron sinense TaxID=13715 RepID=A0A834Y9P5_TETSI|nr:hypothetical protein HHK36_032793 [Tetracentron sinense]
MNRSPAKNVGRLILDYRSRTQTVNRPCDVFINHRGVDTKRSVAGLLYNHLTRLRLHPFLDSKSMKPGDKLFEKIDSAIRNCKVGVAVFSPHYCESYFCLHELALIMETKRKVIPIFCDVKPSELRVMDYGICPAKDLQRFSWALEEAKHTVGLTFDSLTGDWSDLVATASDSVIRNLIEVEEEQRYRDWSDLVATASDSVIRNLIEVEEEQRYRIVLMVHENGWLHHFPDSSSKYFSEFNGISSDDSEKDLAAVKRGLISAYKSNLADKLKDELQKISNDLEAGPEDKQFGRWCTTWWQQFSDSTVAIRLAHLQAQIGLLFFYSGFLGLLPSLPGYFHLPPGGIYAYEERSSCMYGLSSYFMARLL